MQIESLLQSQHHYTTATIILQVDTGIIVTKFQYLFWIFCHMATPCNSARSLRQDFCPNSKFGKRRNTVCTRKGYAASVSQLALATAALYFPFSIPKSGRKRSAHGRRRFVQRFPGRQTKAVSFHRGNSPRIWRNSGFQIDRSSTSLPGPFERRETTTAASRPAAKPGTIS